MSVLRKNPFYYDARSDEQIESDNKYMEQLSKQHWYYDNVKTMKEKDDVPGLGGKPFKVKMEKGFFKSDVVKEMTKNDENIKDEEMRNKVQEAREKEINTEKAKEALKGIMRNKVKDYMGDHIKAMYPLTPEEAFPRRINPTPYIHSGNQYKGQAYIVGTGGEIDSGSTKDFMDMWKQQPTSWITTTDTATTGDYQWHEMKYPANYPTSPVVIASPFSVTDVKPYDTKKVLLL